MKHRTAGGSLDPVDWAEFRRTAAEALNAVLDHLEVAGEEAEWRAVPAETRQRFEGSLPSGYTPLDEVVREVVEHVMPYTMGNSHRGFAGWFIGGGNVAGFLGETIAAGMNTSVAGYDQTATYVERQVIEWSRELFGWPSGSSGVLVSGTSVATLVAVLVARFAAGGEAVRTDGVRGIPDLVGYASAAVHNSVPRAFEMAGLGSVALRRIDCDERQRIDVAALEARIAEDVQEGRRPFFVVANAGTIDTGAFDDIRELRGLADRHRIWLHVDGAFGALVAMSDRLRPLVTGIEMADSLAFDFHKWPHVPYDAGCVMVRDGTVHRRTFTVDSAYLSRDKRGMADAEPWFPDFGPELSRSFRALKVWMTLKHFGRERLGASIEHCCELAGRFGRLLEGDPDFELVASVTLNIVCFRFMGELGMTERDRDAFNRRLVQELQLDGRVVPSSTVLGGRTCIRLAISNHRTRWEDIEPLPEIIRSLAGSLGPGR